MADDDVEYFKPTSGRFIGGLGVLGVLALIVIVVGDGFRGSELALVLGAGFFGVLIWAAILRPRVGLSREELFLGNVLSEARVPLAAIEQLALRQVLAVRVGDRRYVSPGVGRTVREMRKSAGTAPDPVANYCDFVEDRIRQRMDDARARAGIALMSDDQLALASGVRRRWAWPEAVALAVTGVGFVVALIV